MGSTRFSGGGTTWSSPPCFNVNPFTIEIHPSETVADRAFASASNYFLLPYIHLYRLTEALTYSRNLAAEGRFIIRPHTQQPKGEGRKSEFFKIKLELLNMHTARKFVQIGLTRRA